MSSRDLARIAFWTGVVLAAFLLGGIAAEGKAVVCPEEGKVESVVDGDLDDIVLEAGTEVCIKGGQTTVTVTADGESTLAELLGTGQNVSHYTVISTPTTTVPVIRLLTVREQCQEDAFYVTVSNDGNVGIEYLILIGEGSAYHYLEPGESKAWKVSDGAGYAVYVEATLIAEGNQAPCLATTTTTTTPPGYCPECGEDTTTTTIPSPPSTPPPSVPPTSVPDDTVPGTTPTTVSDTEPEPTTAPDSTVADTLPHTGPTLEMSWKIPSILLLVGAGLAALSRKREEI